MELMLQVLGALAALATIADFALSWVVPAVQRGSQSAEDAATDSAKEQEKE